MNSSNNVNRHKENFQFLGNSYKGENMQKKQKKTALEISSSEMSTSPLKLKSFAYLKKDQIPNYLNDSNQFISPSRSNKDQVPNFLNDQIKFISPSHTNKNQIPMLLTDKNLFISPIKSNANQAKSPLNSHIPLDSSLLGLDQNKNILIDQQTITSPSLVQSKNNPQSYELKYKKARQKIKGMKIIIDVLNARVQKALASKQEIEKQVLDLKQQLYDQSQSQIISNNSAAIQSIAISPKSQSHVSSELHTSSLMSSEIQDKDRINNVFDKISRFENTCDNAIQVLNEFQSLISSSSQIQDSNVSSGGLNLSLGSTNLNAQNKASFSNASISNNHKNDATIELIKKKNKQLQKKIDENSETILQLNAKIRRRENENSMLKQQINDLQDSYNLSMRSVDSKQKKAEEYLYNLQERYLEMQEQGDNASNKNPDIIQILKDNEALVNRVKELSMKNSELVRIIYKMQKENPDQNKSNAISQVSNATASPLKAIESAAKPLDSPRQVPDKVDIPMSVKYSFNQETDDKSQDDSGVSCFIE